MSEQEKRKVRKGVVIGSIVFFIIFFTCLAIPFFVDYLTRKIELKDYDIKEGIVSDVKISEKSDSTCENIVVDDYTMLVECGKEHKQQYNVGDKTKYYVYKGKAYHTEFQMKSASPMGRFLFYGMIGFYFMIGIFTVVLRSILYKRYRRK